jgi:heptosyltransferase-1
VRILIVKLGAIGDVVHTLPALSLIRRHQPSGYVAWVAERGGPSTLLAENPCLDRLIEIDSRGWRSHWSATKTRAEIGSAIESLRSERFDVALDFQGLLKSAAIGLLSGATRRIGFAYGALREPASGLLLTERVRVDDQQHVIQKNLRLVEHLGIPNDGRVEFPLAISHEDELFSENEISRLGGRIAMVNPGGGWPTKLWRTSDYALIADRLWSAFGLPTIVTFGPGEEQMAREVVQNTRSGAAVALGASLKQLFALARRSSLFIGGDTGPLHLAAAAGAPIVAIYGPTSSVRNGPLGSHGEEPVAERRDLECRIDCYRRRCAHTSCMSIPSEIVWESVVERLTRSGSAFQVPVQRRQIGMVRNDRAG